MAKVISIMNSKGGVSKTTSTLNIGAYMSMSGYNVLLIDADAQANLTRILCGKRKPPRSLIDTLLRGGDLPIINVSMQMALVPGSIGLAGVDTSNMRGNRVLDMILQPHRSRYDYILIDCPPALNLITYNVIFTSDYVLVPMLGEYLSMEGVETIESITSRMDKHIGGIFFSRYRGNRGMDRLIKAKTIQRYGDKVLDTFIHENVALAESTIAHQSIFDYAPRSKGAMDYENLTKEIITKIQTL